MGVIQRLAQEKYMVSAKTTQEIAKSIIDTDYTYTLEEGYNIPNISSHSNDLFEPMKANFLLNKNANQVKINYHTNSIPAPTLSKLLFN